MRKGDKKGQAFLITAVIILMLLVSFITITNYSKKRSFSTIEMLGEEIQLESEELMDYNLVTLTDKTPDYIEAISKRLDGDTNVYFIVGPRDNLKFYKQNHPPIDCDFNLVNQVECEHNDNDQIDVQIEMLSPAEILNFEFPLHRPDQGEHFYFIIIQNKNGERYIYTNNYS